MSAGWKHINYKQDMAPPGGYGRIPFKQNIPLKGPKSDVKPRLLVKNSALYASKTYAPNGLGKGAPGALILAGVFVAAAHSYFSYKPRYAFDVQLKREKRQSLLVYYPLLEAEKDRIQLREYKEDMESEALNYIGTGYNPDYVIGGRLKVFNNQRWHETIKQTVTSKAADSTYWNLFRMKHEKLGP